MPELAEVEYYRKQWDPGIGQTVRKVLAHSDARIFRDAPASAVRRALTGRSYLGGHAHGKQMIFEFGEGGWLGLHLGMTGKLYTTPTDHKPEKSEHLVLVLDRCQLVFSDYRMFGRLSIDVTDDGEAPVWWKELPVPILDRRFTKERLTAFVRRFPRTPIKTLLLDQRGFPGIGNWMADEICWRAGIAPQTLCGCLTDAQLNEIWKATRKVSRDALRVIGTDWSDPPNTWLFNHRWENGGRCPRKGCGAELQRADLRGRTTCWCPKCQK